MKGRTEQDGNPMPCHRVLESEDSCVWLGSARRAKCPGYRYRFRIAAYSDHRQVCNRQLRKVGLLLPGGHYEAGTDATVRIFNIEYIVFNWNRQPSRGTVQLNARFTLK